MADFSDTVQQLIYDLLMLKVLHPRNIDKGPLGKLHSPPEEVSVQGFPQACAVTNISRIKMLASVLLLSPLTELLVRFGLEGVIACMSLRLGEDDNIAEACPSEWVSSGLQLRGELSSVPGLAAWHAAEPENKYNLPSFSAYPQAYATAAGEYLMMLPQMLESLYASSGADGQQQPGIDADWLDKASSCCLEKDGRQFVLPLRVRSVNGKATPKLQKLLSTSIVEARSFD